jgi:hypothetical protein
MRSASQQQGGGSIMSRNNKEDDEDELEALRLAALESLRAKGLPPPVVLQGQRLSPKHNVCSNAVSLASQALFHAPSSLISHTKFYSE